MTRKLQIVYSDDFNFSIDKKFKRLFEYEQDNRNLIKQEFNNGLISEKEMDEKITKEIKKLNENRTKVNNEIFDYLQEIQTSESDLLKNKDSLLRIGLERPINIDGLKDLVKNVQDIDLVAKFGGKNFKKSETLDAYYIDMYFGIHLHNILRINRAEASRSEFWNSLSVCKEIKEYLIFRNNYVRSSVVDKLKPNSFFIYGQADLVVENHLARPWWATELSRNGSSYESSIDAFKQTQMFTMRWNTMTLIHNRLFSLSVISFMTNQKFKIGIRDVREYLGRVMNDYAASKAFSLDFENYIEEDYDSFLEWQAQDYNPKKLSGPNDFNFPEKAIENKVKILKKITKNALDAKGRRFL